jgi:hypothetical protein
MSWKWVVKNKLNLSHQNFEEIWFKYVYNIEKTPVNSLEKALKFNTAKYFLIDNESSTKQMNIDK